MNTVIIQASAADFDQVGKIFLEELTFHTQLLPGRFQIADPIMPHEWFGAILANADQVIFVAEIEREMERAREWALNHDAREIELNVWELNKRGILFYETLGYQTIQRRMSLAIKAAP